MNKRSTNNTTVGFKMTRRDIEIIRAVYTHRALTTYQINNLHFSQGGLSRCRHRLKLLAHYGFLHREEQPSKLSDGRKPYVFMIDKNALPLLAEELGVFREDIDWRPAHNRLTWRFLDHLLATNDVRIAIELAVQKKGFHLSRWLDDKTLKSNEMKDRVSIIGPEGANVEVTIVPDGYFLIWTGTHEYDRFLEVDMGTETGISSKFGRRTFSRKLRGYMEYYISGLYEQKYLSKAMVVLTVTTSEKRMRNLMQLAENINELNPLRFWFTTFDKVNSKSVLTEPIWHVPGQDQPRTLIWSEE